MAEAGRELFQRSESKVAWALDGASDELDRLAKELASMKELSPATGPQLSEGAVFLRQGAVVLSADPPPKPDKKARARPTTP